MAMLLLLDACENEERGGYSSRVVLFIISFGGLGSFAGLCKFLLGYLIILLASR